MHTTTEGETIDDRNDEHVARLRDAKDVMDRATVAVTRAREHVDDLMLRRRSLIEACVSDPARRTELRELNADLLEAQTDLEIATAAEAQADAATAEAAKDVLRAELTTLRADGDNVALTAQLLGEVRWFVAVEAEAYERLQRIERLCQAHGRRAEHEGKLCETLGEAPKLRKSDPTTWRLACSVAIARRRAIETRSHLTTEAWFAAIDVPWIWSHGKKEQHPLVPHNADFELAKIYAQQI